MRQLHKAIVWLVIFWVRFYQVAISPLFPPCCIHQPTCSLYAILAMKKHGLFVGCTKVFLRLLSCTPNGKPRREDYP